MKKLGFAGVMIAASMLGTTQANALDCFGISVPDAHVLALINSQASGYSYEISNRKTLVIKDVKSISGTNCQIRAVANVTLKRKIRRDAHGTVTMKGSLYFGNGSKLCIGDSSVTDVTLSNTLGVGEAVYRRVANKVLPDDLCL